MKLAALVSGGKDSLYAMHCAKAHNEIKYIVSFISENPDSYMFHVPNACLVKEQAKAMAIPLIQCTSMGEKEKELEDIRAVLQEIRNDIDGVVSGAIASNYQKTRIDKICSELGLKSVAPLWKKNHSDLLREMIGDGFEIIITAVAAQGLDESWLGKIIDKKNVHELIELSRKNRFSVIGEGGEYESLVLDCPMFEKKLRIMNAEKKWDAKTRSGFLKINIVEMIDKF